MRCAPPFACLAVSLRLSCAPLVCTGAVGIGAKGFSGSSRPSSTPLLLGAANGMFAPLLLGAAYGTMTNETNQLDVTLSHTIAHDLTPRHAVLMPALREFEQAHDSSTRGGVACAATGPLD